MKPSPELIPHSEFHTCAWLHSVKRPGWYYFSKKKNPNTIRNKQFDESVDEPLKELVAFLHRHGIKTTPSCSGHHLRGRELANMYAALEEDAADIRSEGLELKDVETGEHFMYKNKAYALPWSKACFLEQVETYQQKGVLGLRLGEHQAWKEQLLKLKTDGAEVREKDNILFIFTDGMQDIHITWKQITRQVKAVIAGETPVAAK